MLSKVSGCNVFGLFCVFMDSSLSFRQRKNESLSLLQIWIRLKNNDCKYPNGSRGSVLSGDSVKYGFVIFNFAHELSEHFEPVVQHLF